MAHSNRLEDVNSPRSKVASISVTDLLNAPSAVALLQPIATEGSVTLPDRDGLPDEVWRLGRGDRRSPGGGPCLRPRRSSIAGCSVVLVDRQPAGARGRRGNRRTGARRGRRPRRAGVDRRGRGCHRGAGDRARGRQRGGVVRRAVPGPEPGEPGRHGAGELPRDHRAGRVGPAADGGARSRSLHRHELRLGAGGHGRRRQLQRQQGLRAQPGGGDRLGAARDGGRVPGRRGARDGHAGLALAPGRRGPDAPTGRGAPSGRRGRARPAAQQGAGSWPTPGWSSWRDWIGGLASSSCRASPARSTPTATRSPSGRRRTPWRPRRWHRDRPPAGSRPRARRRRSR